jgi:hypothetical protein
VTGERDVGLLLSSLDPELHDGSYVFALAPGGAVLAGVDPIATVREEEGLTLVLSAWRGGVAVARRAAGAPTSSRTSPTASA